jgi:acetolactate synthase-1/2/3 large subunit
MTDVKYSDQIIEWLSEEGYTHCFFLAGGNIMHLLQSASLVLECVPFVHEVSAGIAAEYFNEVEGSKGKKAFVLVTAGPGLTNLVTSISGAFLESRELLVIGGQVKTFDLKSGGLRQRGIQEIDGPGIVKKITKYASRIDEPISKSAFLKIARTSQAPRKGPVFLEIPLDVQAAKFFDDGESLPTTAETLEAGFSLEVFEHLLLSTRPVILLGGGLSREFCSQVYPRLQAIEIPLMTTWNGADRYGANERNYWGRPNTWGQRYSNILLQQADLVIAIGTRLGIQQTGFNWQEFAPMAKVIQVDLDENELHKGHPKVEVPVCTDADGFLHRLIEFVERNELDYSKWLEFGADVKELLPLSEDSNKSFLNSVNPYDFYVDLSMQIKSGDVVIPASSGSSMTVCMQSLIQPRGSMVLTNKSLASMGYGLAGAIGAALATKKRVILVEGDGGFAQNLQELGTVSLQKLPIKIFILANEGYASIRMTQQSYFGGNYVGCDSKTGLGLPDWGVLATAFGIRSLILDSNKMFNDESLLARLAEDGPDIFIVPVHPEQTYFPKITSKVLPDGTMISNPIHLMTPQLSDSLSSTVFRYLPNDKELS